MPSIKMLFSALALRSLRDIKTTKQAVAEMQERADSHLDSVKSLRDDLLDVIRRHDELKRDLDEVVKTSEELKKIHADEVKSLEALWSLNFD